MVLPVRRLGLLTLLLVIPLALSLAQRVQPAQAIPGCNSPFSFTGLEQTCAVPANATSITITAVGAQAGGGFFSTGAGGGLGDSVQATFAVGTGDAVTPGEPLYVEVGGHGNNAGGIPPGAGGFNGGGSGDTTTNGGGGGGGASDVRSSPALAGLAPDTRIVVAGGGGGGGGGLAAMPGHGGVGGAAGVAGNPAAGGAAGGGQGTGLTGGLGGLGIGGGAAGQNGIRGSGGTGGLGNPSGINAGNGSGGGGGGGGGYFGGGGGGGGSNPPAPNDPGGGGGGGGSDFETAGATGVTVAPGAAGSGTVTISFTLGVITSTILNASPNPSTAGQPVTFTATVSCPGFIPTGTVTFSDGSTPLATVTLAGGTPTFSTSALALGSHNITAVYNGDINCVAGPSNTVTQIVLAVGAPTLTCTPPNLPAGTAVTCTLAFPSPLLPGTSIALSVTSPPGAGISACSNPTGGLTCGPIASAGLALLADLAPAAPLSAEGSISGSPPAPLDDLAGPTPLSATSSLTLTCPAGCNGGTAVQLTLLSPVPGALALSVTITQPGLPPQTFVLDGVTWVTASLNPTNEQKFCTNTATNVGLNQILGGTSQTLAVTGPATTFTLPLFGGASTCAIQLTRGTAGGVPTPCNATTNPCADGYIVVTLTTPGSGALVSCASSALPTGQVLPAISGGGGTCQSQVQGTQVNIPCGPTAGTPTANTTVSAGCTGVLFDIQAALGACAATPTYCAQTGVNGLNGLNGLNFAGTAATVTVQFLATPANGGTVGGIQLGTNTFTFQGPGIGTLLVAASPQLIPSNGTLSSVISATFACTSGYNNLNGFPLSNSALNLTVTNGVLGINGIAGGGTAQCGAGLPGTFNFSTPGPVLFDNGRSQESISCGPNANVNAFGNGQPAFFGSLGSTFPLTFTCTGAAVLAIGAGVAGDAPINVSYQSAVGGLQAVGSTLITVSPSGVPRISVACNPSTISAGNTGSLCTATVTDINGTPLSGITGATVTFTTSDTSTTSILPCLLGTPGAINVTTSPQVIPLVQPNTPCVTPSSTIPGQVNTFINGQATALLVASSTAHPETVTVTASLGVLVPPSFACLVSPYVPTTGFGTSPVGNAGYYSPAYSIGNPNFVSGCGTSSPIGTTGLATAFNAAGTGLTGIVSLPSTTSAATTVQIGNASGIQVAGATPISPIVVSRGCNSIVVTSPAGTAIASIAALVTPANAVVSVWRFDNGAKLFRAGFFAEAGAPVDFAATGSAGILPAGGAVMVTETYYVCVNQVATLA